MERNHGPEKLAGSLEGTQMRNSPGVGSEETENWWDRKGGR